ncbi:hypothetical protein BKA58DRAFT_439191 [Alternaria rosae]|uniref:uncharacterized protein n=1 Tax=Alternaria rosae TaxID=1187941 RepID=UPI001E8E8017|nr:uncharacterized protein BKA58DRAFT_439191 [Alternaria rosae]KAH6873117.1 hypothetical protein BKA58DRAFT_439191 [Alternaria rosae]
MSTQAAQLLEQQLFTALKTQIVGLATPLYGTRPEDASKVYDVITYSMQTGNWKTEHRTIPNVAGVGEGGQEGEHEHGGEEGDSMDNKRRAKGGRMENASEDLEQTGWSPRLSSIIEEV